MKDRILAGVLTAIMLCITMVMAVFFLSLYRGGFSGSLLLWSAMPVWLLSIGTSGFFLGVFLGTERAVALLPHFWGTATPRQPLVTAVLWGLVAVLLLVTYRLHA